MNIIDFSRKGNVIRFYLGNNGEQWGDDWDDAPYEHNAESVYDQYVEGYFDIYVPIAYDAYEPAQGAYGGNSRYSKQDMINRKVPCLVIAYRADDFYDALGQIDWCRVYFGDEQQDVQDRVEQYIAKKEIERE